MTSSPIRGNTSSHPPILPKSFQEEKDQEMIESWEEETSSQVDEPSEEEDVFSKWGLREIEAEKKQKLDNGFNLESLCGTIALSIILNNLFSDIKPFACVSRKWNEIVKNSSIWERLCNEANIQLKEGQSCKEAFIQKNGFRRITIIREKQIKLQRFITNIYIHFRIIRNLFTSWQVSLEASKEIMLQAALIYSLDIKDNYSKAILYELLIDLKILRDEEELGKEKNKQNAQFLTEAIDILNPRLKNKGNKRKADSLQDQEACQKRLKIEPDCYLLTETTGSSPQEPAGSSILDDLKPIPCYLIHLSSDLFCKIVNDINFKDLIAVSLTHSKGQERLKEIRVSQDANMQFYESWDDFKEAGGLAFEMCTHTIMELCKKDKNINSERAEAIYLFAVKLFRLQNKAYINTDSSLNILTREVQPVLLTIGNSFAGNPIQKLLNAADGYIRCVIKNLNTKRNTDHYYPGIFNSDPESIFERGDDSLQIMENASLEFGLRLESSLKGHYEKHDFT